MDRLKNKKISDKVIYRLTLYHCILIDLCDKNVEIVSSQYIADLLHIDSSQVRKDFICLESSGKNRVGYDVLELRATIENALGFQSKRKLIVVGAGNIGTGVANYAYFNYYNVEVVGLFDIDKDRLTQIKTKVPKYEISKIKEVIDETGADIAILATPRLCAQETANLLIENGIKYIWNMTPIILNLPPHIRTWNENLMGNFLQFTCDRKSFKSDFSD